MRLLTRLGYNCFFVIGALSKVASLHLTKETHTTWCGWTRDGQNHDMQLSLIWVRGGHFNAISVWLSILICYRMACCNCSCMILEMQSDTKAQVSENGTFWGQTQNGCPHLCSIRYNASLMNGITRRVLAVIPSKPLDGLENILKP